MLRLFFTCILAVWISTGWAQDALRLTPDQPRTSLTPYASVYEDRSNTLRAEHIRALPESFFTPVTGTRANLGKSDSTWWFKVPVSVENPVQGFVEVSYSMLDDVQVFIGRKNGLIEHVSLGDRLPWSARIVPVRDFWTPVSLTEGEQQIWVRIKTTSTAYVPLHFSSITAAAGTHEQLNTLNGIFYGLVIAILIYNLAVFATLREKAYGWFVTHIMILLALALQLDGFIFMWLDTGVQFQHLATPILLYAHSICAVQFSRYFFDSPTSHPYIDRVIQGLLVILITLLASGTWLSFATWSQWASTSLLLSSAALMTIGIFMWQQGSNYSVFYLLAWLALLGTVVMAAASSLGVKEFDAYGAHVVRAGILMEGLLLSIGLARRVSALHKQSRHAEQQVLQAKAASEAKSRFLAKISHEIRTPLNGVLGMAELLKETALSSSQRLYVETISGSGNTLLATINDIIDYAKVESGKLKVESIEFDLEALLGESLHPFYRLAREKHLSLYLQIGENVPQHMQGDPIRIKQVLMNLLSNAFKFTHIGYVRVRVEIQAKRLVISVEDTGIGVNEEQLESIFDAFNQADNGISRYYGGSGLGLSICQELCQLMGAELTVESTPLEGSTFSLSFALRENLRTDPLIHILAQTSVWIWCDDDQHYQGLESIFKRWKASVHRCTTFAELNQVLSEVNRGIVVLASDTRFDTRIPQTNALVINLTAHELACASAQHPAIHLPPPLSLAMLRKALMLLPSNTVEDQTPSMPTQRILMLEQHPVSQQLINTLFKLSGCSVETASDGQTLVDHYLKSPETVDIILLDLNMPVLDGYAASHLIRRYESENKLTPVTIVALAASSVEEARYHRNAHCIDAFLTKPLGPQALLVQLKRYVPKVCQQIA